MNRVSEQIAEERAERAAKERVDRELVQKFKEQRASLSGLLLPEIKLGDLLDDNILDGIFDNFDKHYSDFSVREVVINFIHLINCYNELPSNPANVRVEYLKQLTIISVKLAEQKTKLLDGKISDMRNFNHVIYRPFESLVNIYKALYRSNQSQPNRLSLDDKNAQYDDRNELFLVACRLLVRSLESKSNEDLPATIVGKALVWIKPENSNYFVGRLRTITHFFRHIFPDSFGTNKQSIKFDMLVEMRSGTFKDGELANYFQLHFLRVQEFKNQDVINLVKEFCAEWYNKKEDNESEKSKTLEHAKVVFEKLDLLSQRVGALEDDSIKTKAQQYQEDQVTKYNVYAYIYALETKKAVEVFKEIDRRNEIFSELARSYDQAYPLRVVPDSDELHAKQQTYIDITVHVNHDDSPAKEEQLLAKLKSINHTPYACSQEISNFQKLRNELKLDNLLDNASLRKCLNHKDKNTHYAVIYFIRLVNFYSKLPAEFQAGYLTELKIMAPRIAEIKRSALVHHGEYYNYGGGLEEFVFDMYGLCKIHEALYTNALQDCHILFIGACQLWTYSQKLGSDPISIDSRGELPTAITKMAFTQITSTPSDQVSLCLKLREYLYCFAHFFPNYFGTNILRITKDDQYVITYDDLNKKTSIDITSLTYFKLQFLRAALFVPLDDRGNKYYRDTMNRHFRVFRIHSSTINGDLAKQVDCVKFLFELNRDQDALAHSRLQTVTLRYLELQFTKVEKINIPEVEGEEKASEAKSNTHKLNAPEEKGNAKKSEEKFDVSEVALRAELYTELKKLKAFRDELKHSVPLKDAYNNIYDGACEEMVKLLNHSDVEHEKRVLKSLKEANAGKIKGKTIDELKLKHGNSCSRLIGGLMMLAGLIAIGLCIALFIKTAGASEPISNKGIETGMKLFASGATAVGVGHLLHRHSLFVRSLENLGKLTTHKSARIVEKEAQEAKKARP